MDIVCLNGEFVAQDQARISAADAGFLLGDGAFETVRVECGVPLFLESHLARLGRAARALGIPFALSIEGIAELCEAVIDANERGDGRLRITLSRGPVRTPPTDEREGEPTLLITFGPGDPSVEEQRARGWRVLLAPFPRNHASPLCAIKSTCYSESLLARRYARGRGFDEALFLNTAGRVAECAMANILAVRGDSIATPPVADGALPGTVRARILQSAHSIGMHAEERALSVEDLLASDAAIACNSMVEAMPIRQLGERALGTPAGAEACAAIQGMLRAQARAAIARSRA